MKYIYLIVLFCSLLLSCNKTLYSVPIGINIQNTHQITADTNQLKTDWNKILIDNKLKGELSGFKIKTSIDERTEKKYYYLISISKDESLKMASKLIKHNNKFFLNTSELHYVICYGCKSSYPEIYNNYWDCETKDLFNCKKIEIVITK